MTERGKPGIIGFPGGIPQEGVQPSPSPAAPLRPASAPRPSAAAGTSSRWSRCLRHATAPGSTGNTSGSFSPECTCFASRLAGEPTQPPLRPTGMPTLGGLVDQGSDLVPVALFLRWHPGHPGSAAGPMNARRHSRARRQPSTSMRPTQSPRPSPRPSRSTRTGRRASGRNSRWGSRSTRA